MPDGQSEVIVPEECCRRAEKDRGTLPSVAGINSDAGLGPDQSRLVELFAGIFKASLTELEADSAHRSQLKHAPIFLPSHCRTG
jgi:hypothetical protein